MGHHRRSGLTDHPARSALSFRLLGRAGLRQGDICSLDSSWRFATSMTAAASLADRSSCWSATPRLIQVGPSRPWTNWLV